LLTEILVYRATSLDPFEARYSKRRIGFAPQPLHCSLYPGDASALQNWTLELLRLGKITLKMT